MLRTVLGLALAMLALASGALAQGRAEPERPRVGLVLSGGGARGLAHVGVLKVLERERIPIDAIAGTSMGAIIGGLYASGMGAAEIERELVALRWDEIFAPQVERPRVPQRRKEQDADYSPVIELGMRDGVLMSPKAAVSSRGLDALLRRYTLRAGLLRDFDALPIPFRAVATDMETGEPVVLGSGDLAVALRSSMSVPGVFAPTEVNGRILGDGGLVNNVPIDVARGMGVDRVIVVNIGTPLAPRATLSSVVGLTTQMINILTEQNVQRSLATLAPRDVLITPQLGAISSADFDKAPELVALGEQGAQQAVAQLAPLALDTAAYAVWRAGRPQTAPPATTLAFVRFEGSQHTRPERYRPELESRAGQPFDPARAQRDVERLAASGDYARADYKLVATPEGEGLVFELEDKPWGPHYFRLGLDLSTDFGGRSAFNLKLGHTRRWLTDTGTEWRNRLQIGESPALATELYHPLAGVPGRVGDWFVAAYGSVERRLLWLYGADDGHEIAQFRRTTGKLGFDIGQPWSRYGELRLGVQALAWRTSPRLLGPDYTGPLAPEVWQERGLRLRTVVDQLDHANFPLHGYRFEFEAGSGERRGAERLRERYTRFETEGTLVASLGRETFSLHGLLQSADTPGASALGRYTLGGFHQLSGYRSGQLVGNAALLARLTWYHRLTQPLVLTRGFFVGATLEAGNAWASRRQASLGDVRTGMSAFLGADTGLGPLYLGLTYAPGGEPGVVLFIGRP
ncbi:MAG: patatin-like phospholipase family protein [Pseudomonadota bacterium]